MQSSVRRPRLCRTRLVTEGVRVWKELAVCRKKATSFPTVFFSPPCVVFFSFSLLTHSRRICSLLSTSVAAAKYDQTKAQTKHLVLDFPNDLSILWEYIFAWLFFFLSFFPSSSPQGNHLSHIHLYKLISSLQEKIKTMATEIPVSEG